MKLGTSALYIVLIIATTILAGCGAKEKEAVGEDMASYSEAAAQQPDQDGMMVREFDLNTDQVPDVFKYFQLKTNAETGKGEYLLVKRELDLNGDGRIDVISVYTEDGQIESETFDLDFDGRIDLVDHYINGQLVKKSIDFAFDEQPDMFKYYLKGQLVRKEKDRNNDGRIDYWEYYENGQLDRIGADLDGDGEVDTWNMLQQEEEAQQEATSTLPSNETEENAEESEQPEEKPAE